MALDLLDEHEQGEQVQKWLRENAMSILLGVGLGLLLIFGWQQWLAHRAQQRLDAATQYEVFLADLDKNDWDTARQIAAKLRSDFANTPYAAFAALRLARAASERGDLATAADALDFVQAHAGIEPLRVLGGLYRARIELAENKAEDALRRLDGLPALGYQALREELRGDALAALGRRDDARRAYTEALTHLEVHAARRPLLEMKRDDLGGEEGKSS
jgi:predicted negative regulator of RcsB-dependent stress response